MPVKNTSEGPNPSGLCMCGCGQRTNLAIYTRANRSWVKGKPLRFVLGHQARRTAQSVFIRYEVDPKTGCWGWSGVIEENGYGRYGAGSTRRGAHVMFYERFIGPVPEGLVIHHVCGNRSCVNPEHLQATTHAENIRAGRGTKLTVADVIAIRALHGKQTYRQISQRFGISKKYVANIVHRETWRDI